MLAHKTSKRKRKFILQKRSKSNGKVNKIQRASILEPQNKQPETRNRISTKLILTQAKQRFSIQVRVQKWQRNLCKKPSRFHKIVIKSMQIIQNVTQRVPAGLEKA